MIRFTKTLAAASVGFGALLAGAGRADACGGGYRPFGYAYSAPRVIVRVVPPQTIVQQPQFTQGVQTGGAIAQFGQTTQTGVVGQTGVAQFGQTVQNGTATSVTARMPVTQTASAGGPTASTVLQGQAGQLQGQAGQLQGQAGQSQGQPVQSQDQLSQPQDQGQQIQPGQGAPQQMQAPSQGQQMQGQPTDAQATALQALTGWDGSDGRAAESQAMSPAGMFTGNFMAQLSNGSTIQLTLYGDGSFRWIANNNGKTTVGQGSFTLQNGTLTLLRTNDQQKLEGGFTQTQQGFVLHLNAGKETNLNFVRG